jgi:hypothetical protein
MMDNGGLTCFRSATSAIVNINYHVSNDWYEDPPEEMQKVFHGWDYISPHTLKAELGIAAAMDESNRPYKILQLMGE